MAEEFDLEGAVRFVSHHTTIINMNIVDFYTKHMNSIPAYWFDPSVLELSELDLITLATALYSESFDVHRYPAVLHEFLLNTRKFSLNNHLRYTSGQEERTRTGQRNERKSMKKRHEVHLLAALINSSAPEGEGMRRAIDFGAGQGYLSQTLADNGWEVVALERDDGQCHGSIQRQADGEHRPYTVHQLNIYSSTTPQDMNLVGGQAISYSCYCSLHACGSLSLDQIRLFLEDPTVDLLANVGCCYNLMREGCYPPLSQKLACFNDSLVCITERTARMLACQAPWRWSSKPTQSLQSFKSNHYRALFQAFVLPLLGRDDVELGHLPSSSLTNFQTYVRAACTKVGVECPDLEFHAIELAHNQKRLAVVWTLRALLGPAIESILLLDRYYLVKERLAETGAVQLVPLFDPVQSPRNFVLVARRNRL